MSALGLGCVNPTLRLGCRLSAGLRAFKRTELSACFVPEGDIRDARHIRPQPGAYEAWQASVTLAWG
jgi:hypothetical protein